MALKTLSEMMPSVAATARTVLGHDVLYTPAGGAAQTIKTQGDYSPNMLNGEVSVGIDQDIELMVLKTDLAAMPADGDRITLPRVPGKTFKPVNVHHDETAEHWLFNLKRVI